jgi:predicted alpha/beta superfamily hydrolase
MLLIGACKKENLSQVSLSKETFYSSIVKDDYILYSILPSDYSEEKSYPLVFFLDGDWYYEFFEKEINRLIKSKEIPPCIVIGLGYPLDGGFKELCSHCTDAEDDIIVNRIRDYTYPMSPTATIQTGGAPTFARVLNEELIPKIESEYSIDTNQIHLMGHSLGGLGVLYNLFQTPTSQFDGFAALSGSLYWGGGGIFALETAYHQQHSDLDTKLYIAYGSAESGSLVAHNAEIIERLEKRNYPSLKFKSRLFKGASHRQVSWDGFREGLKYLLNN